MGLRSASMCSMMHEVVRPDVIAVLWMQPDTWSIVQPEPSLLGSFHWHFEPLAFPQTLDTFVIRLRADVSQQGCNPAIAISAVLACQFDHVRDHALLVGTPLWQSPLCGSLLAQDTANATFRNLRQAANEIDAGATTRGAQKFPRAASGRINSFNVSSDTERRRCSFFF